MNLYIVGYHALSLHPDMCYSCTRCILVMRMGRITLLQANLRLLGPRFGIGHDQWRFYILALLKIGYIPVYFNSEIDGYFEFDPTSKP